MIWKKNNVLNQHVKDNAAEIQAAFLIRKKEKYRINGIIKKERTGKKDGNDQ